MAHEVANTNHDPVLPPLKRMLSALFWRNSVPKLQLFVYLLIAAVPRLLTVPLSTATGNLLPFCGYKAHSSRDAR
jgi:hypothetical protein